MCNFHHNTATTEDIAALVMPSMFDTLLYTCSLTCFADLIRHWFLALDMGINEDICRIFFLHPKTPYRSQ